MSSIIIADDDPDMLAMYQHILNGRDYDTRYCTDGDEVLTAYEEEPADLVILDVNMPGKDGLDTTEELRKRLDSYNVPIIIVSANDSEQAIVRGLSYGADEYIVKPFKPPELLAKISIALKKRGTATHELGLAPGGRFAGKYEIAKKVGAGGFSSVFLASDMRQEPPTDVALKVYDLPPSKRDDQQYVRLFLREAYEHSRLDHKNITKLRDFGQSGGLYYLAMEFLHGKTLDQVVKTKKALPEQFVALIGHEVAMALRYMSKHEVVHRDIKPANIMITADGDCKVLDFGLAKREKEDTLSINDEFRGTPQFVSPEYIRGADDLDIASDIYSLGATLYFAATNARPFSGDSTVEILNSHFEEVPAAANTKAPALTDEFCLLLDHMMAREREDRPPITKVIRTLRTMM